MSGQALARRGHRMPEPKDIRSFAVVEVELESAWTLLATVRASMRAHGEGTVGYARLHPIEADLSAQCERLQYELDQANLPQKPAGYVPEEWRSGI